MVAADPGQVHPPSIPQDDGVKEALDQIQAMLRDPQAGGLVDDPQTAELLQKVGLTVADLYQDQEGAPMPAAAAAASSGERPPPAGSFAPDMGEGTGGEAEGDFDEYEDDEEGEYDDGYGEPPAVQLRSGPQPVELWRAKHESADPPRAPARKMRKEEWDRLVDRLNASSRRKKQYQGIMQAKREKEEMEGYRFRPTITRRSRALAEHLKSLPERMQALMHRRKAKIDKVKEEKAQRELAEATFRPNLNKPTRSRATEMQERMRRKVGHLLRYDLDKQMRAKQRRQIQQEVEDRELTFSPRINRRSTVLVQRMMQRKDAVERKVERQEQLTDDDYATLAGGRTRRAQERANAKTAAVSLATLEREMDLGRVKRVKLGPRGLTMLPGHEQETFHPRIDPRSRAVAQGKGKGKGKGRSVHDRLYLKATASMRQKRVASGQYFRQYINTDMDVSGGIDMGVTFQRDVARAQEEDEEEAAARAARAGRHRAVAEAPEKGYVNEVVYAQDFDAIVRLSIRAAEQAEAAAVADQEREEEERERAGVEGVDEGK